MRGRFDFFLVEALKSLRNNLATTTAAIVTVFIVMFIAGVGIGLGSYVIDYSNHVRSDVTIKVYLSDKATGADIQAIKDKAKADRRVRAETITFVTKPEAQARARKLFGKKSDLVNAVSGNPFPADVEFKARNPSDTSAIAYSFRAMPGLLKSEPSKGLPNPDYGSGTADTVIKVGSAIIAGIGIMGIVLAIAAVLLVGNTIRLSIYARRREVEVMKLVGATNWFVRWPFMLEGMICGILGAVAASLVLFLAWSWVGDTFNNIGSTRSPATALPLPVLVVVLLFAGLGLGSAGAGLTLRRFLRV